MAGLSTFSDLLGYSSIACWLGAQFPQVLENIRRQSCEGLALPFLANWFLGDLSNLIGCILTHQLPFQTYLAVYFVFVDLMLVCQYFYYQRSQPPPSSFGRVRSRAASTSIRRTSADRGAPRYRTLSAVAANVAAAAALAAQQDERIDSRYPHGRWQGSADQGHETSANRVSSHTAEDVNDVDENAFAALAESFHSEGGREHKPRHVSWSTERRGQSAGRSPVMSRTALLPSLQITSTELPDGYLNSASRGRSLRREVDLEQEPQSARQESRASRRGASMVFLGAWALFGVGTLVGSKRGFSSGSTNIGRVLWDGELPMANIPSVPLSTQSTPLMPPDVAPITVHFANINDHPSHDQPHDLPHEPSGEQILGRIFAWLCTTLYLTSRLPQIWKNFVRKSVEGLSMYLFVFAFLGNCFYVSSILTSPKVYLPPPASTAFLKESLPYLLGSGGTLMFDVTIVSQSFIYRPRRRRQASTRSRISEEEESGLLSGDSLSHPYHGPSESVVHSRGRTSTGRNTA